MLLNRRYKISSEYKYINCVSKLNYTYRWTEWQTNLISKLAIISLNYEIGTLSYSINTHPSPEMCGICSEYLTQNKAKPFLFQLNLQFTWM